VTPRFTCPSWRWIVQWDTFAGHLDGVRVTELVWGEAAAHARLCGDAAEVVARRSGRPWPSACLPVNDAEQRPDRDLYPAREPASELFEAPVVHPDFAPLAALALADEQRASGRVEVRFGQRHRLADPKAGPPEHDNQGAQPQPVV
jgi:hypothetical protein